VAAPYGYKVHAAVCTATSLSVAWKVETAKDPELPVVPVLLDSVARRGFAPDVCVMDRSYDVDVIYDETESRRIRPVVPLRQTPAVKAGKDKPPACEHGEWTFAGSDAERGASKSRCPTAECDPQSVWVKASRLHPLIPRNSDRFRTFTTSAGHGRARVRRFEAPVDAAPAAGAPTAARAVAR